MPTTPAVGRASIDEIAPDVFRISSPVTARPGGFTFNQFLIKDELPLLFHTGPRAFFDATIAAINAANTKPRIPVGNSDIMLG